MHEFMKQMIPQANDSDLSQRLVLVCGEEVKSLVTAWCPKEKTSVIQTRPEQFDVFLVMSHRL